MACKIDRGTTFDCTTISQGGIGDYLYLVNKEDFDNYQVFTIDGTSKEMTALTLASTTQGYKFQSSKGSAQIIPSSPLRAVTALDGFDHTIDVRVLDVSQLSRENIQKMRFQKVVAFIPLLAGGFLLYGQNVGLRISDYQENPGDADTGGTIQFVLKTPDNDPPEKAVPLKVASTYDITELDTPAA